MRFIFLTTLIILSSAFSVAAQLSWPKVIPFKNGGGATIYQPQPESFEGNKLAGRSAVAVRAQKNSEPVFGVIFFEATMQVDKATRIAVLQSIKITASKFTGVDDTAKLNQLNSFLEREIPKWDLEISIDALIATIKKDHPNAEIYNNDPPEIIYATKPSTLVILNGDPYIKMDKKLEAERVLNTPSLIIKDNNQWNMYVGGVWYRSNSVLTGWSELKNLSPKLKSINQEIKKQEKENNDGKEVTAKPEVTEIIVRTKAAELIQSKGEPTYKDIEGTSLSFVSNSPNNIFKDKKTGQIYILIAGRWFKSNSFNGPWKFNEPDKLPEDFAKIPEGSDKDEVLASVAGTDAAEEAMIDAEIPQTAKIDRKTATVKVEYDGSPIFNKIQGTSLELADNANVTVMKESSGTYFALDNGVWFTSNSANGPWAVATRRPKDVENIPMQNKAYNTKFVHIYEVADDYTIQGYTAGYLGSYIQGDPVIVFGTGFFYAPWYGNFYYPGPCTWGFGFSYNPWYGWSMNYGFNIGFVHVSFGFGWGGWFGPPMYHPPFRPPYWGGGYYGRPRPGNNIIGNNININVNSNNIYRPNRPGSGAGNRPGISTRPGNNRPGISSRPGGINRPGSNNNIGSRPNARPGNGSNNIFSDKQGNVFQRDANNNIRQRDNRNNNWQPTQNKAISREAQIRDRGQQRTNNFNQMQNNRMPANRPAARPTGPAARPSTPASRPGGGGMRRN